MPKRTRKTVANSAFAQRPLRARLDGGFWGPRLETNRTATLAHVREQLQCAGQWGVWDMAWKPEDPNPPHVFWDSDLAKWMEGAARILDEPLCKDPELEAQLDGLIAKMAAAQWDDGYLNSHYTLVEPENRWTNLESAHELYCAGHLIEAAIAYHEATGKTAFLDVVRRYADHIAATFGPGPGQKRGYPGHQELELALVKLYRATGERRYLDLARYFIDERGREPHYYNAERVRRGAEPHPVERFAYNQSHAPVREQERAVGHAVRAMYLYSAMADLAGETGDAPLFDAARRLWESVVTRQMTVTGGIGPSAANEGFAADCELPNDGYYETCAAIGLILFAHRMLQLDPRAEYADVMERALYNGVLSGVALDGRSFFYENPLESSPRYDVVNQQYNPPHRRQSWFTCACCPTNVVRFLASLGDYVYGVSDEGVYVHLYASGTVQRFGEDAIIDIRQRTEYPWKEKVTLDVKMAGGEKTLYLRMPGWCREPSLTINGEPVDLARTVRDGYARITRVWKGDTVELRLPMPVERVRPHPALRDAAGCVALQRGPVIYCIEEEDNGPELHRLVLPPDTPVKAMTKRGLLGGVSVLRADVLDVVADEGRALYAAEADRTRKEPLQAIPYFAWANREPGEMRVWIREALSEAVSVAQPAS